MDVGLFGVGVSCAIGGVLLMAIARYMMAVALHEYDMNMHSWRPSGAYLFGTCHRWADFYIQFGTIKILRWGALPPFVFGGGMACVCIGMRLAWVSLG